jgi:redox-sensitive bicupin YhaK (pirin superfamily)
MDVAPHPHIGLQTVTWLLDGEIVHDDSLEQEALLRPGGVNIMTSGRAIAHAERTPDDNTGRLNGVQLWTALPGRDRHRPPSFQHLAEVPRLERAGGIVHVFSGALAGAASPAEHFSNLVGADLQIHPRDELTLPLEPTHEHALLVLSGSCTLNGQHLEEKVLLIGGVPFPETILMWWNFVARTPEEIREARNDWEAHRTFGDVAAYKGARIPAPALVRLAQPNPVS